MLFLNESVDLLEDLVVFRCQLKDGRVAAFQCGMDMIR